MPLIIVRYTIFQRVLDRTLNILISTVWACFDCLSLDNQFERWQLLKVKLLQEHWLAHLVGLGQFSKYLGPWIDIANSSISEPPVLWGTYRNTLTWTLVVLHGPLTSSRQYGKWNDVCYFFSKVFKVQYETLYISHVFSGNHKEILGLTW